ncbi:MAG TPA: hypothetical protein DHW02_19370, partial [Ktedonobacter sp.]|nr:hypothetical protein [Ktedonobacter sp.]
MLITRIELENIKSYKKMVVDFRRGTTAISGANGAGKTTLVESIGYALFDYLPYKQEQFIREGEKFGLVTVHLIGGDDRPYTVERRCGSRSRWFIYDEEANDHVEQKTDVLDKLHDLFGIDRERPLDSLFRDALGVPQGTFTAIFLDKAASRKQTFDALLQVEDYKTAFEKLLETQRLYKEQMMSQQGVIQRLEYETRDLDTWRNTLSEAQQQREQQERQSNEWSQLLLTLKDQQLKLKEQERALDTLGKQRDYSNATYTNAQNLLREREYQAQVARDAQRIVEASLNDYQRYREADATLVRLRKDEQQRSRLLKQQSDLNSNHARVESNEQNWLNRLEEVESARQKVAMLMPLVKQQDEHEKKRDELVEKKARYDEILKQGTNLRKRVEDYQQKQGTLHKQIADVEPLEPVANLFEERNERLHSLLLQSSERLNKQRQLQEKQNELETRNRERDVAADKLRKAETNIATIEEHRSEAEEMPHLETRRIELIAQEHLVRGNIDGYVKSRSQSAGGQCPLLHEGCLNIRQRGIVSLESYFDGLLTKEHEQLDTVRAEQAVITQRENEIKKYVDWFNKLGTYSERRDNYAVDIQRLAIDIARLEREIRDVHEEVNALSQLPALIEEAQRSNQESKDASQRVRELPGLHKQMQQLQEQIEQGNEELEALRAEIAHLKGVDTYLAEVKASLVTLNNPRLRWQTQQNVVNKAPEYEQNLQQERIRKAELEQQLQALEQQLKSYAMLDNDIQQQEAIRISSGEGYQ